MSDFDAIRRTYAAAAPLLDLASQREIAPHLSPSGAQLRAMMGEVELEQGAVAEARTLLRAAAGEEPSGAVLLSLARIDRHDGQPSAALQDLRSALDARDARHDAALHGEVLLLQSDLFHDLRDAAGARAPLVDALELLSRSRAAGPPEARARVEQVLARVLDRFGATDKARQASERALEAAPHDKHMVAAALGQIVARALVQGDLLAAREGLARGVAAELDDDEVVYLALWVRLLERQMRQARDVAGAPAASVFARIPDSGRWIGKLAAFGAGKLSAADLPAFARTGAEKTEATFYQAMDRRVSGGADGGATELRAVLQGDGVELMETVIARDILRKEAHEAPLGIPADVKLP
jgi:tetratricopeptide (TPR) repeat protein